MDLIDASDPVSRNSSYGLAYFRCIAYTLFFVDGSDRITRNYPIRILHVLNVAESLVWDPGCPYGTTAP